MKVGFFYQFTTPGSEKHLHIGTNLLESVRENMPGVEVYQFTDETSAVLPGVDFTVRIGGDMPMAVRRMTHHASVAGDWLFVDTDVVIQKDVCAVFEEPFDIAVTDRIGTEMEGTPYGNAMPYNMGVTFSRSQQFWQAVLGELTNLPKTLQHWTGDQMVVCHLAAKGSFNVKVIPGRIYNYPPVRDDEDVSHAAIVHYKGRARKGWLDGPEKAA